MINSILCLTKKHIVEGLTELGPTPAEVRF